MPPLNRMRLKAMMRDATSGKIEKTRIMMTAGQMKTCAEWRSIQSDSRSRAPMEGAARGVPGRTESSEPVKTQFVMPSDRL